MVSITRGHCWLHQWQLVVRVWPLWQCFLAKEEEEDDEEDEDDDEEEDGDDEEEDEDDEEEETGIDTSDKEEEQDSEEGKQLQQKQQMLFSDQLWSAFCTWKLIFLFVRLLILKGSLIQDNALNCFLWSFYGPSDCVSLCSSSPAPVWSQPNLTEAQRS